MIAKPFVVFELDFFSGHLPKVSRGDTMSAKLRYHQRDGHIVVTWDHCRIGTITCNDDGTFDASTIRSKYHLPKVSMIEALKYYRKFNWRSFLDATEYVPAQVRYESKQPKLTCTRWAYF